MGRLAGAVVTQHTCPQCGGPDGVLLLESVAPCDACLPAPVTAPQPTLVIVGARRRWVRFGQTQPIRSPPRGCIGWDGYGVGYCDKADRDFKRLPNPDEPLEPAPYGFTIGHAEILSREWRSNDGDAVEGWYLEDRS